MGDKRSGKNYPHSRGRRDARNPKNGYNTEGYYANNRELGSTPDLYHDYADSAARFNPTKRENYKGEGYYGSNYGSINELRRGRDIERNAGYRSNYNELDSGQWPEVQEAADRRGFDLHWHELQERGVHRGKGPRSYQRSDFRISEDVQDVLLEDRYIDATDIEVKVEKGEVILTGTVDNKNIKRRVEDVIEDQVSGITHLENRLRVKHPGGQFV